MKLRRFSAVILCIALLIGLLSINVSALSNGVYVGNVITSYYNPDTGAIDDGGTANAALGEGMCRDATGQTGLIEVDSHGNIWLTVRLLLASNCRDASFSYRSGNNQYTAVNYEITQENAAGDYVDYHFQVPSAGVHIQATMYVEPMGRDVLWYLHLDPNTLQAGHSDFITTIDTAVPPPAPKPTPKPVDPSEPSTNSNGTYVGNIITSYYNPDTGAIDDGGTANAALGEGMCRDATGQTGLIEVDSHGNIWLTVRLLLASNCRDASFSYRSGNNQYTAVNYEITQENTAGDYVDYHFQVPSAGVHIQATMYVEPMGRDVLWYLHLDPNSLRAGHGDFTTTIDTKPHVDQFTDVSKTHWAYSYIDYVVQHNLFNGTSRTTFSPDASMNRAMFVTVLGRLHGVYPQGNGQTPFTDISTKEYFAPYVAWAVKNGIVKGTSETTFSPLKPVTREDMTVFLYRYCNFAKIQLKDGPAVSFADEDQIHAYAKEAVSATSKANLINGIGNNMFSPQSTAKRAQVAKFLTCFIRDYHL